MNGIKFNNGKVIKNYGRPYIIAEVNSSHNGDVDIAKKMIDAAIESGCDCVKFQSWSTETLYSKSYYQKNPIAKRFVNKLSLTSKELKMMAEYCEEKGIGFSSTPYSKQEVDFLVDECKVPFIKIASMEIDNLEFLSYIAKKNVPIVLSTGMADMQEIDDAVREIENVGNKNIVLLHCVSIYPVKVENINLNNIIELQKRFPEYPIGFSDHTLGDAAAVAAVTLGASVIEKHITLDAKKIGMDNQMAMEPKELSVFVEKCQQINLALGSNRRIVLPEEIEQRKSMRRSVIVTKDIKKGHILCREDLDVKRPGIGITPKKLYGCIGKTVNRDIEADTLLMETDLEYDSFKN